MVHLMRVALVLCLLLIGGCASAERVIRNGTYDPGNPDATFDLYRPVGADRHAQIPVLLAIHGGAWRSGDKEWGSEVADEFCPDGYAVVAINYRLAPAHRWPAQIEDCQTALRWLRANATMVHIDPDRIASIGVSAGGHLAAMLALRGPDRVRAGVDANGEGDLTVLGTEPIMADEVAILSDVLGPPPFAPAILADLTPVRFARRDAAVLIIHSRDDPNVYFAQGARLHDALVAAGATTGMVVLEGDCHSKCWAEAAADIRAFLARTLH